MIVRFSGRRPNWLSNIRHKWIHRRLKLNHLLDEAQFLHALEKERSRSLRRDLVFAVIRFEPVGKSHLDQICRRLVPLFRSRLRITDEIGIYQSALCVLLPETTAIDAGQVANDLVEIAGATNIKMETEISVYPESPNSGSVDDRSASHPTVHPTSRHGNGQNGNDETRPAAQPRGLSKYFNFHAIEFRYPTPIWKRGFDVIGSALAMITLSPVLVGAAIAIRLTTRGPVLFKQLREGKDGRFFYIYKFRTMKVGADEEKARIRVKSEQDGPAFKIKNDPRVTAVGRYLRMSCVDELPQLFNVLRGEMSLVGPRPLPVDESARCSRWHRRRLDVLPGMTCIWQVCGGRNIPFEQWMRMDLEYIRQRGLLIDLKLLCQTAFISLMLRGSV